MYVGSILIFLSLFDQILLRACMQNIFLNPYSQNTQLELGMQLPMELTQGSNLLDSPR